MRAQRAKAEGIVAFGEASSGIVGHQVAMVEGGRIQGKRTIEKKLPRGGEQQVGAANDFRDLHGIVVHNHGQLVSRQVIMPPDDEVSEILASGELLRAEMAVGEVD